jgi:quercetin dioxygenase-like cupin family protein
MIQSEMFQTDDNLPWETVEKGVQRKIMGYGEQLMMVKVKFEAGALGAIHEHHHIQVTYVESGSFVMTIGNETKIINQGDGYYVPAHVLHGVVCTSPGILIDVFTPHRADFL